MKGFKMTEQPSPHNSSGEYQNLCPKTTQTLLVLKSPADETNEHTFGLHSEVTPPSITTFLTTSSS
jgi:hypothetical protein